MTLYAACVPLIAEGWKLMVHDEEHCLLSVHFPDWDVFRPATARKYLEERGYVMVEPDRGSMGWIKPPWGVDNLFAHVVQTHADGKPEDRDWDDDVPPAARHAQVEAAKRVPGMVWLGDLSGFWIDADIDVGTGEPYAEVQHRCGWSKRLPGDGAAYLGNTVCELAHECQPHTWSPETAAMVREWTERASGGPVHQEEAGA